MLTTTIESTMASIAASLGTEQFLVSGFVAVVLVSLACGLVGSLVVGNRMAFFSDALSHTALAGVALGLLGYAIMGNIRKADDVNQWVVVAVMIGTGILTGLAMEFVRERTGLTNDTVIGVFFAAAIGFAALLIPALRREVRIDAEAFLFGSVVFISPADLLLLLLLVPITAVFVAFSYNTLTFASFSPQLARSRGLWTRLAGYLFIGLLAVVVNASIKAVGALLINALLVVPAAGAANLARNLRQMFWVTILASVGAGVVGFMLSLREISMNGKPLQLNSSGAIVLSAVAWFFFTMPVAAFRLRVARAAGRHVHSEEDGPAGCCPAPNVAE